MQKRLLGFIAPLFLFSALCSAQSLSIIAGNGQLVCPNCPGISSQNYSAMTVQVNDVNGKPVAASTSVVWKVTQQGAAAVTVTIPTNSSGQSSLTWCSNGCPVQVYISFGVPYSPVQATATALNVSANFVGTTVNPTPQYPAGPPVTIQLNPPVAPPALTGAAGSTAATSIKVVAGGALGALVGVQVRMDSGTPTQPTVSCATAAGQQAGTVLTDPTGTATCTPVFGAKIGSGTYTLTVGGNYATFIKTPFTVTAGPPSLIKIISGNTQSVNPGTLALLPLTAEVTDLGGNASNAAAVKWAVTQGVATLSNTITTSSSTGLVSARVTPTTGPVSVTVSLASNALISATFTVNVNVIITGISASSGTPQSIKEAAVFPDPLIVLVSNNSAPVPGVTVNFAVSGVPVTLSAPTAVTDAQGQAQITATAGPTDGAANITATVTNAGKTYTTTFTLTVLPPGPIISGISNAAGFQDGFVSPCALATIFGSGFATGIQGVVGAFIGPTTQLNNVTVSFGGVLAPILQMANVNDQEQVSVQVPCETQPGTVSLVLSADGVGSLPMDITVSPVSPGIFETVMSDGKTRAVLVRPDGSFVSLENPARRGETIRMFVTGSGPDHPGIVHQRVRSAGARLR